MMLLLVPDLAMAQIAGGGVNQKGAVTPDDCAEWASNGVIQDVGSPCGTATSSTAGAGLTASPNPITGAGTLSLTVLPAVSATGGTTAERDAYGTLNVYNLNATDLSTSCSGGSLGLSAEAPQEIVLVNGSGTTESISFPDATLLPANQHYNVNNQCTGSLTLTKDGGGALATIPSGAYAKITLIDGTTSAGVWSVSSSAPANSSWGTSALTVGGGMAVTGAAALNGGGTSTTPSQFDNSTKIATTAFANLIGLQENGANFYSTSTLLTNANVGGIVGATSGGTMTLPPLSGLPSTLVSGIWLIDAGGTSFTVAANGSDEILNGSSTVSSLTVGVNNAVHLKDIDVPGVGQIWVVWPDSPLGFINTGVWQSPVFTGSVSMEGIIGAATSGSTPTVSCAGSSGSGSLSADANLMRGTITTGVLSTSCVVAFNGTISTSTPHIFLTADSNTMVMAGPSVTARSSTGFTVSFGTAVTASSVEYFVVQ